MTRAPLSVARRYARALLDAALAKDKAGAEALQTQLRQAATLIEEQPDLAQALTHPALPADKKKKVAAAVWKSAHPLFGKLIDLLIVRGRTALLPGIAESYTALWNQHRGIVAAEAVSAVKLAPAQEKALTAAARKLAGHEVTLTTTIDPTLLGGVVLRMNGRTYDGSLRAQLRTLRARLASGAPTSSSPR